MRNGKAVHVISSTHAKVTETINMTKTSELSVGNKQSW